MKSPRFFCENCGAEVPRDADTCPGCGRYFSSVKCPKCGFVGSEDLFRSGCPTCGYSSPVDTKKTGPTPRTASKAEQTPAAPLPTWVYLLTFAALILTIAFAVGFFLY